MPIDDIYLGVTDNDGLGDDAKTAGQKINANFAYVTGLLTPGYEVADYGTAAITNTSGDETTNTEIVSTINTEGFTVTLGKLIKLQLIVIEEIGDSPSWVRYVYDFKQNNVLGGWGTGTDNGVITYEDLIIRNRTVLGSGFAPAASTEIIALGFIGSGSLEDYLNALDDDTYNLLDDGTTYYFDCNIAGEQQTYLYVGTLPVDFGQDTSVTADFDLIASVGMAPAPEIKHHEFACSDETSDLATGTVYEQRLLRDFTNCTSFDFGVITAPTGSTIIIDVQKNSTTVFDTKPTIDATEFTTLTATTPQVITGGSVDFSSGDIIKVVLDQIGSTIAGVNLKAQITYNS